MIASLLCFLSLISTSTFSMVVVLEDGRVATAPLDPALTALPVHHTWVWSPWSPPHKFLVGPASREPPRPESSRLEVRVANAATLVPGETIRVVAAPLEMWAEVPEAWLPSFPISAGGRASIPVDDARAWRVRLQGAPGSPARGGRLLGSWWHDLPAGQRRVSLVLVPAEDRGLQVLGAAGLPLAEAVVEWREAGGPAVDGPRRWTLIHTDEQGKALVPSLPDLYPVELLLAAHDHVPTRFQGRPSSLPDIFRLDLGATLRGRLVDSRHRGIAGARVVVESTAAHLGSPLAQAGLTGKDGTFQLTGLPAGEARLRANAETFVPRVEPLELGGPELDLGEIQLAQGVSAVVEVIDDSEAPVVGAEVSAGLGRPTPTDVQGRAVLHGLEPERLATFRVRARGHRPAERVAVPALEATEPLRVTLVRALRLSGRLVDSEGMPVSGGVLRLATGRKSTETALEPGGAFDLDAPPGEPLELEITAPNTRALTLTMPPGAPGEVRDLGDLPAPRGITVTGTVVSARDGSPVVGARLWVLRPGIGGELFAWASGDLLETASGPDGGFRLSGLPPEAVRLRIDGATPFARHEQEILPRTEDEITDLGNVELQPGATVLVDLAEDPGDGTTLRVDLRGEGLAPDLLTASVVAGKGRLEGIPAGDRDLRLVRNGRTLCDHSLALTPGGQEVITTCTPRGPRVSGIVRTAGRPSGPGTLVWEEPPSAVAEVIFRTSTPTGLSHTETLSPRGPAITLEVAADGTFATRELTPGPWLVSFYPEGGAGSPPRAVALLAGDEVTLTLDVAALEITGRVLDRAGQPVAAAIVRESRQGGAARSDSAGNFRLGGLEPGQLRLQAETPDASSPVVEVLLPADGLDEEVVLIPEPGRDRLAFRVVDAEGAPLAGAFVFLEEEGRGLRVLTTDGTGIASARVHYPPPPRLRAAAVGLGQWVFGLWQSWPEAREGVELRLPPEPGRLVARGAPASVDDISSESRWSLRVLFRQIGAPWPMRAGEPWELAGLPPGIYSVAAGERAFPVEVLAGEDGEWAVPVK